MANILRIIAFLLIAAWAVTCFVVLQSFILNADSTLFGRIYLTVASLHNFTAIALIIIPVFVLMLPLAIPENIAKFADRIDANKNAAEEQKRQEEDFRQKPY